MAVKKRTSFFLLFFGTIGLPIALCLLFSRLKQNRPLMDRWVFGVVGPIEQCLGRVWSVIPISMAEVFVVLAVLVTLVSLLLSCLHLVRHRSLPSFLRRICALIGVWLWLLTYFNWFWNSTYYASAFAQRSGLSPTAYSLEDLATVTYYFAQQTALRSDCVPRDEAGHMQFSLSDCIRRGPAIYENLAAQFPCLELDSIPVKPLLASRLQSILGFTGVYFPFTGEANVNVDQPICLIPATIGHEMAHQRMVASELEANFVGIAACTTSDDVLFQYSGYLMGLIQLCNALYPVAPDLWYAIAEQTFTAEMSTDWNDNNNYWAELESSVEEVAEDAYDSFLKSNDQELGIRSYGACVDLLVAYYRPIFQP